MRFGLGKTIRPQKLTCTWSMSADTGNTAEEEEIAIAIGGGKSSLTALFDTILSAL